MKRLAAFATLCVIAPLLHSQPSLRIQYYPAGSQVWLSWTAVTGAASYSVERTTSYPAWSSQATGVTNTSWPQSGLSAGTSYLYRIVPRDGQGAPFGSPSNVAIVNTHSHADNPLDLEDSVALQHVNDLRMAVASVRAASGAGSAVWTNNPLTLDSMIADEDLADLRNNLNAAYTSVGLPLPAYIDPVLTDVFILRLHFQQVRDLTRTYPELVTFASAVASEPFFSPNADGVKDATSFSASVAFAGGSQRVDFRWRVDVRNQSTNVVVRSMTGSGTGVSFLWDGKNAAGSVQPETAYGFELIDLDSLPIPVVTVATRIDLTAPTSAITSPADAFIVSNVRLAGGGSVAVTGTAIDAVALQQWTLERTGNSQSASTINSGTAAVSSSSLGTWQTIASAGPIPNGGYTLKLTVTDKAGNSSLDTVPVTVGHFSVSRSVAQANAGTGEVVTYTSVVPFPLNLRIEIWSGGALVSTLVNGPRDAGTHNDVWSDLDLVPDGLYHYIATATEGSSSVVWDTSGSFPSQPAPSQLPYPKCWTGTAWLACSDPAGNFEFDPYAGKPLRIAYCVGGGEPDTGCTAAQGALVVGKVATVTETTDSCDSGCFINAYQAGRQELLWYGKALGGTFVGDQPNMTVIRKYNSIADNRTVVYGTAPVVTSINISPTMFSPGSVPSPVVGQVFTINMIRFENRSVTVTASFRNTESGSLLRTITTAPQSSNVITFAWDGRADDPAATRVAPGLYNVTLVVKDSVGSATGIQPMVIVRY